MPCSGIHRNLGTHISQVRSITLDTWTPSQIAHFQKLGNSKAANYFEACLPADFRRPHASDTQRMEQFTRDKYENRRFITVENGGLGGAEMPRHGLSVASNLSAPPNRSLRPSSRQLYEEETSRRPTASTSYAARFATGPAPHARSATANPYDRPSTLGPRPGMFTTSSQPEALKRASTLRELVNMGFPTNIALRAVQASRGDLQQAVEWVLQNTNQNNEPAQPVAPPSTRDQPNLLDFDEPDAPPMSTATIAPAHTSTNGKIAAAKAPAPPPAHFTDFADFGDFESALPTAKTNVPSPGHPAALVTTSTTASVSAAKPSAAKLGGSLADLYKKGPPKPPSPSRNPASRMPSLQTSPGVGAVGTFANIPPKALSPLSGGKPISSKQALSQARLGMPVIDLKQNLSAAPSINMTKGGIPNGSSNIIKVAAAAPPMKMAQAQPPPPPPPMQEEAFLSAMAPPPPPNPPPSRGNGKSKMEDVSGENVEADTKEGSPKDETQKDEPLKEANVEEEVEEDPFAALSMMALSSATKVRKDNPKPVVPKVEKVEPVSTETAPAAPSKPAAQPAGDFNLDDFFG